MTKSGENLRKAAQEAADSAQNGIAELDRKLAEIEQQKLEIEAKRMLLRGTFQRLANYPLQIGADYVCPLCWVKDGKASCLKSVPGPAKDIVPLQPVQLRGRDLVSPHRGPTFQASSPSPNVWRSGRSSGQKQPQLEA
jgi:hypothetical protein